MSTTQLSTLLILGLLVVCPARSLAHDGRSLSLTGTVTDPRGERVVGATVRLHSRDGRVRLTVRSDESGRYRFERLAPGEYLLDAEARGFAPTASGAVRVESDDARADVALALDGVREEVVVTAADAAQEADEISKAVSLVGGDELDRRDEHSIPDAVATVPGVRLQRFGGPGAFATIKIRGLRNEDTAVLVDGLRFRDVSAPQGDASGFLEDLLIADVDRIEVLRGSASSLYGTNAIGGALNIVSGSGGGRTRGAILAEGGSLGLARGHARIAGGLDDDRFAYSLGVAHLNVSDGLDGADAVRETNGHGRLLVQLSPTATLTGRILTGGGYAQLNESPIVVGSVPTSGIVEAVPLAFAEVRRYENGTPAGILDIGGATFVPSFDDADYARDAAFFSGALTFAHRPWERFGYTVSYQGVATSRAFLDGPAGIAFEPSESSRFDYEGRTHTLNARASAELGSFNRLDAGYEFEREVYRSAALAGSPDDARVDVAEGSHTFFAHDQLRLLDGRFQLSAAFRVQHFSLDAPVFEPSDNAPFANAEIASPPSAVTGDGSLAYVFRSTATKVRAHVGNGYRAPSLYERFGTYYSGFFGYSTYGDPRLRPERSIAVDAGIDQSLAGGRVRASATYFYTRLQEVVGFDFSGAIDPATDPYGRFGGYLNTRGGLSRGVEASLAAAPSLSTDLSIAYTFTNADQRVPGIAGIVRTFGTPNHQLSVVATQRVGARFSATVDLVATSDYLAPIYDPATFVNRAYEFGGLRRADVAASYAIPIDDRRSIRVFGKVENVFDDEYFESGFGTSGATASGGVQFQF